MPAQPSSASFSSSWVSTASGPARHGRVQAVVPGSAGTSAACAGAQHQACGIKQHRHGAAAVAEGQPAGKDRARIRQVAGRASGRGRGRRPGARMLDAAFDPKPRCRGWPARRGRDRRCDTVQGWRRIPRPSGHSGPASRPWRGRDRARATCSKRCAWASAWLLSSRISSRAVAAKLPQIRTMQSGTVKRMSRAEAAGKRPSDGGGEHAVQPVPRACGRLCHDPPPRVDSRTTSMRMRAELQASPSY